MGTAKNNDHKDYIREALSFGLELHWERFDRLGIRRNRETEFHPGQTIVMYPPFEALSPDFNELELFDRVASIEGSSLCMYLHVPFCTGICTYCSYARSACGKSDVMETYVEALLRQRDEWVSRLGIKPAAVDTVFIGGGTPTTLDEKLLMKLVDTTPRSRDCEFSVETDPDMTTRPSGASKLAALRRAGVNRISMGVETFDDALAKAIGRRGHDQVNDAITVIRQAGFDDINIDLMYGLPNQSLESWLATLKSAADIDVPSITLYCFKLKPGSIDWKRNRSSSTALQLQYGRGVVVMQKMAEMYLCDRGYSVVNGKWFVKTKKTFRQQTRKYQNATLLGLGPATYSFVGNHQFTTQSNTNKYIAAVNASMPVVERGRFLCGEEIAYRRFVFGLKTGVDMAKALADAPPAAEARISVLIDELADAGLLAIDGDRVSFSDIGRLFADEICHLFYSPAVNAELDGRRSEQSSRTRTFDPSPSNVVPSDIG